METNAIAAGSCESESILLSQSKRSLIDSISIELIGAKEKEDTGKCRHFSIRRNMQDFTTTRAECRQVLQSGTQITVDGIDLLYAVESKHSGDAQVMGLLPSGYVADIRKKDKEICWPFSSVGNSNESKDQMDMLPPLDVAEFRWWGCQNCLQKTVATGAATEMGVVSDSYDIGLKSNITCPHGNSRGDALMIPPDFKQAFEKRSFEGRKDDANTSIDVNGDVYWPFLCSDKKGKKAEVLHAIREEIFTSGVHDAIGEENVNRENYYRSTCVTSEANPWRTGVKKGAGKFSVSIKADKDKCNLSPCDTAIASEYSCHNKNASGAVTLELKGDELILFRKPNCESNEVVDVDFDFGNLKCTSNRSAEISQMENPGFFGNDLIMMNEKHREVMTDCRIPNVGDVHNEALNTFRGHTSKLHSLDLDESDHEFTANNENLVGIPHDQHHGNSSGAFHQKKPKKVRLLTDIIQSEMLGASSGTHSSAVNEISDHIKTNVACSNATLEGSIGTDLYAVPKTQVGIEENVKKCILGKKKRNKVPQDEDLGPKKMNMPKSNRERVGILKGVAETCRIDTAIVNSESTEGAFIGIDLHTDFNHHLTKDGFDRKLILCKKKNKKLRVEDVQSSLLPQRKGISREAQVLRNGAKFNHNEANTLPLKPAQDTCTGKGLKTFLKRYLDAKARKSTSCKKRSKMPRVEDGQGSLTTRRECMSRNVQVIRKDAEINQMSAGSFLPKTAQYAFTVEPLQPFFGSYLAAKEKYGKCTLHKNKGKMCQAGVGSASLEAPRLDMSRVGQINHTGFGTVACKSARDSFTGSQLLPSLESNLSAERRNIKSISFGKRSEMLPAEAGQTYGSPTQEDVVRENPNIRKEVEIKHSVNIPLKSSPCLLSGRDIQHCLKSNKATYKKINVSKKRMNKPQTEGGASSPNWLEDLSGTCRYENSIDVQSCSEHDKNQCARRADEACEAAVLDDIPMEIVELMARNQYERHLLDAEDTTKTKYCLLETTQNMKPTASVDLTEVLESEMLRMLKEKNSQMQKCQSSNAGIVTSTSVASANHVNTQYKSTHFNATQPEESLSLGLPAFSRRQEKLSSGVKFSVADSSNNCYTGIHNWNGDRPRYRCSYSCLDCTCQAVSHQRSCEESHHGCLSMPNPQKSITESSNKDMLYQCPKPLHIPKTLNPNPTNLQKENGKFDSGNFKRSPAANPFECTWKRNQNHSELTGPLDLYTNESISAMHLLRLMDAGMSVNVDKKQKSPKQPSFSRSQHRKELSGIEVNGSLTFPPSDFGKNLYPGKSRVQFSPIPAVNAVSSFQKVDSFRRATAFTDGVWSETTELGANKKDGISRPAKSNSVTQVCSVNRNPADFTIPEAGNIYMIGGETLKQRKMLPSLARPRPGLISTDGRKRQRVMKLAAL